MLKNLAAGVEVVVSFIWSNPSETKTTRANISAARSSSRPSFHFLVSPGASWAQVFIVVDAVHGGILVLAEIALYHTVDVSLVDLGRLDQGVHEGIAGVRPNSVDSRKGERSLALVTAEARKLGLGSELLGLETAKAEGVKAGKGAGVFECLLAHRALRQLFNCDRV